MNKLWLLVFFILLPGCGLLRSDIEPTVPEVKIITETVQLEIYQPPLPPEIQLDDVKWFVLTENNLEDKITEVENYTGTDFVIFGMTPQSYENMAYNLQEIRRYIRQQTEIIKYYREATKVKGADGWLEENNSRQNDQLNITTPELSTEADTSWFRKLIPGI